MTKTNKILSFNLITSTQVEAAEAWLEANGFAWVGRSPGGQDCEKYIDHYAMQYEDEETGERERDHREWIDFRRHKAGSAVLDFNDEYAVEAAKFYRENR